MCEITYGEDEGDFEYSHVPLPCADPIPLLALPQPKPSLTEDTAAVEGQEWATWLDSMKWTASSMFKNST